MQRIPTFLLLLFAVLHAGCATLAETPQAVPQPLAAQQPQAAAPPATTEVLPPTPASDAKPAALTPALPPAAPHVALLLPLKSAAFARAATAVQQGFMAAAGGTGLDVKVYPTDDQTAGILSAYQEALQQGARLVVGPLTRNAVTALAASSLVGVPTLALNQPDAEGALPQNLYLFSLSVEAEARQIARSAFADGRLSALVVGTGTLLSKRTGQAFLDEWSSLRGQSAGQIDLPKSPDDYPALRETIASHPSDMIFLAADADRARLARPYLSAAVATYATSQIYGGKTDQPKNIDLTGIRFVDMPWLLQPDHPAVMAYPRADFPSADLLRLYAFGIDAFRLAKSLVEGKVAAGFTLDGVTGSISVKDRQVFERALTPAQFVQGEAVILELAAP